MKPLFFLFLTSIGAVAAPSFTHAAESSDGSSEGSGGGNVAIIRQTGGNNVISIQQSGTNNRAVTDQDGEQNHVNVIQSGKENDLEVTQTGDQNTLERKQTGKSRAVINQNGEITTIYEGE